MTLQLVTGDNLPGPNAALTDIIGMLRKIADRFERGEDPLPEAMLWVACYEDGEVGIGLLGGFMNKLEVVGALDLAKTKFNWEPGDSEHSG